MSAAPSVDCLIVSYNTRELTRQTIATLLSAETGSPAELTVSVWDNASSDGSAEMIEETFPGVRLHRSAENLGFGAANNALARMSRADYLLLLNSDVVVTQALVDPLLAALETDPMVMVAGPRLTGLDGAVQYSAPRFPTLRYEFALVIRGKRLTRTLRRIFDAEAIIGAYQETARTEAARPRDCDFIWGTCWMLRRAEVTGGIFDPAFPMYDEDLDFCRTNHERGRRIYYAADVPLTHIGGASSATSRARYRLVRTSRRRYYRRHHGRLSEWIYVLAVPAAAFAMAAAEQLVNLGRRSISRSSAED